MRRNTAVGWQRWRAASIAARCVCLSAAAAFAGSDNSSLRTWRSIAPQLLVSPALRTPPNLPLFNHPSLPASAHPPCQVPFGSPTTPSTCPVARIELVLQLLGRQRAAALHCRPQHQPRQLLRSIPGVRQGGRRRVEDAGKAKQAFSLPAERGWAHGGASPKPTPQRASSRGGCKTLRLPHRTSCAVPCAGHPCPLPLAWPSPGAHPKFWAAMLRSTAAITRAMRCASSRGSATAGSSGWARLGLGGSAHECQSPGSFEVPAGNPAALIDIQLHSLNSCGGGTPNFTTKRMQHLVL